MTDLFWRFDLDELFSAEDLDQEALAREAEERERMRESRKEEKKDERAPLSGRKLYIVDGYSLIYRSYFAFLTHPLTDSEGNNVSAFFGFFNTVFMLIRDYKFDYFVIAMDSKGPTFRHRMYPEYKANREAAPQDLHSQVPLIMDALKKLNIPYIAQEGYEADDLIATLAANASRLGVETVMVTGDKDLLQLVDDRVGALRPPKKNQPKYTLFGPEEVKEEFGIAPTQIVDYLSLLGDSSDNVPGVKGIGEKGAVKLLEEYVSLDGIYRHLDSLSKGLRAKLEEGKESAYLSRDLVRLKSDVFTLDSFDDDRFLTSTIDYAHAVDIFKKHNCFSLAKSAAAMARKGEEPSSPARTAAVEEDMEETAQKDVTKDPSLIGLGEYQVLKDIKTVRAYFEEARRAAGHIAFDIETSDLDTAKAELVGFSFSYGKKKAFYCPLKAAEGTFLALDDVMALFNEYFSMGKLKVIGQNIKFDLEVLSHLGLEGMEIEADTMIYAWLLDSASSSYSLESLALRYLSYEAIAYDDIVPKGADFSAVPLESAMRYGAEDSDLTYRLYLHLGKELEERDLMRVFRDYELPLIPVLARMAAERGIPVFWTLHDYKLLCPAYSCLCGGKVCERCFHGKMPVLTSRCMKGSLAASLLAWLEAEYWSRKKLERWVAAFVCPSAFMASKMRQGGFPEEKLKVLCNFIPAEYAESLPDAAGCGSGGREEAYCYVGRLSEEKGVETLLKVASGLPYKLYVAGDGPLLSRLREEYASAPQIVWLGRISAGEVRSLLGRVRFSVLPSEWYENNPLSAIESFCSGTPLLGARIGGIPELIEEGATGMTFEAGNQKELKEKIIYLFAHRLENSSRIRESALERFSQEAYYRKMMTLYDAALRG